MDRSPGRPGRDNCGGAGFDRQAPRPALRLRRAGVRKLLVTSCRTPNMAHVSIGPSPPSRLMHCDDYGPPILMEYRKASIGGSTANECNSATGGPAALRGGDTALLRSRAGVERKRRPDLCGTLAREHLRLPEWRP